MAGGIVRVGDSVLYDVQLIPKNGVGGYGNTLWYLVFNFLGSSAAVLYLAMQRRRTTGVDS